MEAGFGNQMGLGFLLRGGFFCWNRRIFLGVSMRFHEILGPRPSPAPEDSHCIIIQDYLSVVSRRFYPSIMYIMSQSPPVI